MKFSLIVPVFNTEPAYFHECMDSILNQDYEGEYEVILIDDGSTTDIGRICDWYQQKDPRIMVIHQENRGVSEARNEGIRRAGGEWLYFIDPDDWIEINALSSAAAILRKYSLDILYVAYQEDLPNTSTPYGYGGQASRPWISWIRRESDWVCWTIPITACHAVSDRSAPNFSGWSSLKKTICVSFPSFAGCRIPCLICISWMPLPAWASWTRWFIITGRTRSPSATGSTLPSRNIYWSLTKCYISISRGNQRTGPGPLNLRPQGITVKSSACITLTPVGTRTGNRRKRSGNS